uniref:DNA mismatch repair proteins mutS family domain-containing protein n=1 Tax=Eutreptiella gymnastica TaxID=73025 RepID=A0A7S1I565_9EUGL
MTDGLKDAPVVMALSFNQEGGRIKFGCAYCNTTLRVLGVSEFTDGDQFLNLETFIIQIGAKECLVPAVARQPTAEEQQIFDILQRTNVVRTEIKKGDYSSKDIQQDLSQLLADTTTVMAELELKMAMPSMAALVRFLDLLSDETNNEQFKLRREDLRRFMKLDTAAVSALNLFPTDQHSSNRSNTSLYGLMNRCQTAMAQRTLRQWIAQPLIDVQEISKRQDLVEIFTDDVLFCTSLRDDILRKVPDLDTILKKMQRKRSKLGDAVDLGRFLGYIPQLVDALRQYQGRHQALLQSELVEPLEEISSYFEDLQTLIENTLEQSGNEVLIQPSFDDDLEQLAEQKRKLEYDVNKAYKQMLSDLDISDKFCKVDKNSQNGFYWKINRTKGNELTNLTKKSYEVILTNKSGTNFTNKNLKRLNQDYSELLKAYMQRQSDLEQKFLETVASYAPVLEDIKYYLTNLDLYICFASVAMDAPTPYVRPTVLAMDADQRQCCLKGARHPMLEVQEGCTFIPNDYAMDRTGNMLLITGPNMGGKSTYIRTAGVIQLMAQIGMPVPCTAATLSVCDALLARVGATDYQIRGVSTFMAEMLETSAILSNATEHSFIIVDELGRGTSTYDGFGLAYAICESIACEIGAFCLFATHFHELTHMASVHGNVRNLHVTADTSNDSITMLYQLQPGPCEKSFGIHVAELAKFPPRIVKTAKRKAAELENFTEAEKESKRVQPNVSAAQSKALLDALLREFSTADLKPETIQSLFCKVESQVNEDEHIRSLVLQSLECEV